MEDRILMAVYADGAYRVSQYCEGMGFPERVGLEVLKSLEVLDLEKLRLACLQCNEISLADVAQRVQEDPNWVEPLQFRTWVGAEILSQIVYNGIRDLLVYPLSFYNSAVCDWAFVVDFDTGAFELYKGDNHEPVPQDARFYTGHGLGYREGEKETWFYPVRLASSWPLDHLPARETFLDAMRHRDQKAP